MIRSRGDVTAVEAAVLLPRKAVPESGTDGKVSRSLRGERYARPGLATRAG